MIYQIKEKAIYSESDLLHFGEVEKFGEIINTRIPDYSGIDIGAVIYQNTNKAFIYHLKTQLELSRIRTLNGILLTFFDDDERASQFYASKAFSKLQEIYRQDFDLTLTSRMPNSMEVEGDEFYLPAKASEEQIIAIQQIFNLYFFTVETIPEAEQSSEQDLDWDHRLALLFPDQKRFKEQEKRETEVNLNKDFSKNSNTEKSSASNENKQRPKPWWKFW